MSYNQSQAVIKSYSIVYYNHLLYTSARSKQAHSSIYLSWMIMMACSKAVMVTMATLLLIGGGKEGIPAIQGTRSSLCHTTIFCFLLYVASSRLSFFHSPYDMSRKSLLQRFRRLDAYAKPLDDIRIRTASGAYGTMEALHGQQTFSLWH